MQPKKILIPLFFICFISLTAFAQNFHRIEGWPESTNLKIEKYLESTKAVKDRKVAVFDCDGTIIGQSPYYLSNEVMCSYAKKHLGKNDTISKNAVTHTYKYANGYGNPSQPMETVLTLAGISPQEAENIGWQLYKEKYADKVFPQMIQLIKNLKEYGFEVWAITGAQEVVYQKICSEVFGIPITHIYGAKTIIADDKITDQMIKPIPEQAGKKHIIETFIKAQPMFVAGNSRGDLDMLIYSKGMQMIVNPDNEEKLTDSILKNQTLESYSKEHGFTIVNCKDQRPEGVHFDCADFGIKTNKPN
ncbi:MAG: HAD family hydrolase [Hyphomicrobiales bacterium]